MSANGLWILGILVAMGSVCAWQTETAAQERPLELGEVDWLRDLDEGCRVAKRADKLLLVLFQEIPGCQTCQDFGARPLSHPLLVEAIEELFVPVAIYNNKPGKDEAVLKQFNEPAWNNPVIRYLDLEQQDIVSRKDHLWTIGETAARMVEALTAADKPVPTYLQLVADENSGQRDTAVFAMHCYWEGEGQLGGLAGVENTSSAWLHGKEVVEVTFDPAMTDYETLVQAARELKCAGEPESMGQNEQVKPAKTSDQKYYLRQSLLKHLPLTPLQATRINAALHERRDSQTFLSPRQRVMLEQIQKLHDDAPSELEGLVFPEDAASLAGYQSRLLRVLEM